MGHKTCARGAFMQLNPNQWEQLGENASRDCIGRARRVKRSLDLARCLRRRIGRGRVMAARCTAWDTNNPHSHTHGTYSAPGMQDTRPRPVGCDALRSSGDATELSTHAVDSSLLPQDVLLLLYY
ncbi:unnamed protein product, partial [Iphiclides podalirius]